MKQQVPYNPLEKANLGKSVADALLQQEARALDSLEVFDGAGIYALYYQGHLAPYRRLAHINRTQGATVPIYVGKAIPVGGRKGLAPSDVALTVKPGKPLFKRLLEHAESIRATDLKIEDFTCRYLVVDDIWIPLGESLLITRFSPLWNLLLDGFGNHDPGSGRYNGLMPKWDALHPGREWAARCRPRAETAEQIAQEVAAWLDQSPSLAQSRFQVREAEAEYLVSGGAAR